VTKSMNRLSSCILLLLLVVSAATNSRSAAATNDWIFRQGYYSHSPTNGDRIAQYAPVPWVDALPDARPWMSGYHRSRVTQRGPGGTIDDYYRVENWSSGRGGLDAEWERFHQAWQGSFLSGGYGSWSSPAYPYYGSLYPYPGGGAYGQGGWQPGYGPFPWYGNGPHPGRGQYDPHNPWPGPSPPPHGAPMP
jgi:hypothetical protein